MAGHPHLALLARRPLLIIMLLVQHGARMRDTTSVGWSPEAPAKVSLDGGKHTWNIGSGQDAIPLARHTALSDDGHDAAQPSILAARAEGAPEDGCPS